MRAVQREANQLVEEFMLAANMAAAELVSRAFPCRALLRRHPPPHQRKMEELALTFSLMQKPCADMVMSLQSYQCRNVLLGGLVMGLPN